ncbi:MAG TPA: hypothetical protein VF104_04875 [Burkholderiales bacterium]
MKAEEKRLLALFRALPGTERRTLLEFAEFLTSRAAPQPQEVLEPRAIPRPDDETVVKAVRRLMDTYPMLDRGALLHETAHYMTQHVIHGRPAAEVIGELETMFAGHYQRMKEKAGRQ